MLKIFLVVGGVLLLVAYFLFVAVVYVIANGKEGPRASIWQCFWLAAADIGAEVGDIALTWFYRNREKNKVKR